MIFLDNHSTTQIDPHVLKVMMPYLKDKFANASSIHMAGKEVELAVEKAREQVAALIGAKSDQIFFTNSATEANNMIFQCAWGNILTTNTEHPSISETIKHVKDKGWALNVRAIKVKKDGTINIKQIEKYIADNGSCLVSIIAANNEIGTIHDIKSIGEICKQYAFFHTDATQAIGKVKIDIEKMNIFSLTLSSHKIYGPKGVGAFCIKNKDLVYPLIHGGYQNTFVSGTVNHPAIIGFGKACELMMDVDDENKKIGKLRDLLLEKLTSGLKDVYINGSMENRLPGNISLTIPGLNARHLVENLEDVMISSGSACMSSKPKPSNTIKALGIKHPDSVIRIGVGRFNTEEEIEVASDKIIDMVKKLRK